MSTKIILLLVVLCAFSTVLVQGNFFVNYYLNLNLQRLKGSYINLYICVISIILNLENAFMKLKPIYNNICHDI